ncbi:hypothetical protein PUNSTDRAFT_132541 [Punctularia strigosozonata HHB-11173 SS5]|uniref:uncharacterized protein n=1 Tax=Punctularia strigosozonata (strain HHB-11173) TaxID=741275 RepID=UPI00044174B7|nr:uncharacterized protein PUNSTDRAFT_132541 [Punctularia strigosozonata HHB-11173 SS5]EIN10448.1 hypothetical protein PUNSTDRAFT_132541 [Punctularia strigosozonata HHB-11173 SS5]
MSPRHYTFPYLTIVNQDKNFALQRDCVIKTEGNNSRFNSEIAVLRSQVDTLQQTVLTLKSDHGDIVDALKSEHERNLALADERADRRSAAAEDKVRELTAEVTRLQIHYESPTRSQKRQEEMIQAERRIQELIDSNSSLVNEIDALRERGRNIQSRHENGDLTTEERVFIAGLVGSTKAIFAHELIDKRNELRQRENKIEKLTARITFLESSLRSQITDQSPMEDVTTSTVSRPTTLTTGIVRSNAGVRQEIHTKESTAQGSKAKVDGQSRATALNPNGSLSDDSSPPRGVAPAKRQRAAEAVTESKVPRRTV